MLERKPSAISQFIIFLLFPKQKYHPGTKDRGNMSTFWLYLQAKLAVREAFQKYKNGHKTRLFTVSPGGDDVRA